MTAVGCGTVEVNPPQHSIKRREKCGLEGSNLAREAVLKLKPGDCREAAQKQRTK